MPLRTVLVPPLPLERFVPVAGREAVDAALVLAHRLQGPAEGRRVWNVNSTAFGGGVAEMLRPLLSYARGAGIDARWVVIEGDDAFFRVTKRLHAALHGEGGDRMRLGQEERALYERVSRENAADLLRLVRAGDVVLLHDPQTAGLAPYLLPARTAVVWRCHVGRDEPNAESERAWAFLAPYLEKVPLGVFSREAYVPAVFEGRATVVMPSIDPFSPKNEPLEPRVVRAILCHVGLITCAREALGEPVFLRADGSPGRVGHYADVLGLGPPPPADAPLVVQVSRWDALKDPTGVMAGFAHLLETTPGCEAHLMLAGPNVHAVDDDPDAAAVYQETATRWRALPHAVRRRVHLASLPTHDVDENAAIVNALQRHATVVVQKSRREGFGLTVAEAMWKRRAVVASAVGGLVDQVVPGETGLLVDDPDDHEAFARAVGRLLADPPLRERMGESAHERVRERFLGLRALFQYGGLMERLTPVQDDAERESILH
ncbi:MAG: Trehalose synthase [Pseudomonadota bacterium]|jgi:trehalose synthase